MAETWTITDLCQAGWYFVFMMGFLAVVVLIRPKKKNVNTRDEIFQPPMVTWQAPHRQSEQFSSAAHVAKQKRDHKKARNLYRNAAEAEEKALKMVPADQERTRGIVGVSAVSCWYKSGEYKQAERLAHSLLSDPSFPNHMRDSLRDILRSIWDHYRA